MKLQLATACAVLSLGLAGSAFADGPLNATLETPTTTHVTFFADNALWNCDGAACTGSMEPGGASSLFNCRALARKVGRLTAYGAAKPLDEANLAKCNTAAASASVGTAAAASATVGANSH